MSLTWTETPKTFVLRQGPFRYHLIFVGFIPSSELSVENNKHALIMPQSKTNLPAADAMVGRGIILKIGFIILISSYLSDQADFFAWDIMLFERSDGDVATSHIGAIAAILNIDFDIS